MQTTAIDGSSIKFLRKEIIMSENKRNYVETAELGTIIAFTGFDGRVRSAKISSRDSELKQLKAITKYGAEFTVRYEDVLWVKTGKRWPKGVYMLLKGKE